MDDNKVDYEKIELDEKVLGKSIVHAPQPVTTPPVAPNWAIGSGGSYLADSNFTNLTTLSTAVTEIYNALLKEGLIKKK